jgi:hypothetical protein
LLSWQAIALQYEKSPATTVADLSLTFSHRRLLTRKNRSEDGRGILSGIRRLEHNLANEGTVDRPLLLGPGVGPARPLGQEK